MSASDLCEPNPAAELRPCAAPVTDSQTLCLADLTVSAADSTLDSAARSSACSTGAEALASASESVEAAIEFSPCSASVAPNASGSDCEVGSSA